MYCTLNPLCSHYCVTLNDLILVIVMAGPRQYHERVTREEVFESSENDKSHWSEADATALFESMQQALHQLVRKYEVRQRNRARVQYGW